MKIKKKTIFWHVFLGIWVFLILFPLIYALSNSFKTLSDAYNNVFSLIPTEFTLDNYRHVLERQDIVSITWNTFKVASMVTIFKTLTSILAAYSFVFFNFNGKKFLYFFLISTMFIPFSVTMIPNYLTISNIGLRDTLLGVMLPQFADALGIFLIRQSMKTVPLSLIEYARLENISNFQTLKDVILPIIKPNIISTGIMLFINSWNELVWPVLILKSESNYTLSLALQMYISSEGGTDFTIAMSVSILTIILPICLFLIFNKQIIGTFSTSGIK